MHAKGHLTLSFMFDKYAIIAKNISGVKIIIKIHRNKLKNNLKTSMEIVKASGADY